MPVRADNDYKKLSMDAIQINASVLERFREELLKKQERLGEVIVQTIHEKRNREEWWYQVRVESLKESCEDVKRARNGSERFKMWWKTSGLSRVQPDDRDDRYYDWQKSVCSVRDILADYYDLASKAYRYIGSSIYVLQHGTNEDLQKLAKIWNPTRSDVDRSEVVELERKVKDCRERDQSSKTGSRVKKWFSER